LQPNYLLPEQLGWFSPLLPAVQDVWPAGVFSLLPLHSCDDDPVVQCELFFVSTGVLDNEGASISIIAATITIAHIIFVAFFFSSKLNY
jgi:hypothetical protein